MNESFVFHRQTRKEEELDFTQVIPPHQANVMRSGPFAFLLTNPPSSLNPKNKKHYHKVQKEMKQQVAG